MSLRLGSFLMRENGMLRKCTFTCTLPRTGKGVIVVVDETTRMRGLIVLGPADTTIEAWRAHPLRKLLPANVLGEVDAWFHARPRT